VPEQGPIGCAAGGSKAGVTHVRYHPLLIAAFIAGALNAVAGGGS
jgi:hypothetical protein